MARVQLMSLCPTPALTLGHHLSCLFFLLHITMDRGKCGAVGLIAPMGCSGSLHLWGSRQAVSLQSLPVLTPHLNFYTSTKLVWCSHSCPVPNTALGLQPEADLSDGNYWYHFIYLHEYIPRFQVHMQGSNMYGYLLR